MHQLLREYDSSNMSNELFEENTTNVEENDGSYHDVDLLPLTAKLVD